MPARVTAEREPKPEACDSDASHLTPAARGPPEARPARKRARRNARAAKFCIEKPSRSSALRERFSRSSALRERESGDNIASASVKIGGSVRRVHRFVAGDASTAEPSRDELCHRVALQASCSAAHCKWAVKGGVGMPHASIRLPRVIRQQLQIQPAQGEAE